MSEEAESADSPLAADFPVAVVVLAVSPAVAVALERVVAPVAASVPDAAARVLADVPVLHPAAQPADAQPLVAVAPIAASALGVVAL